MTKEEAQGSPGRKKPIPQPRKIMSASSLDPKSVPKSFWPEPRKDVCPVPTAQFKSFKRVPDPSSQPEYVNTTPPPLPSNPPPPLGPRDSPRSVSVIRSPNSVAGKPPSASNVVLRSKKAHNIQSTPPLSLSITAPSEMSPNRFGHIFDATSKESSVMSTPYYMSDLYGEGSAEKKWIESLRRGPLQASGSAEKLGLIATNQKLQKLQQQKGFCDSVSLT